MSGTGYNYNRIFSESHPDFQRLIKMFEETVRLAQQNRQAHNEWFRWEMQYILNDINWERAQRNKEPVSMRVLLRRETSASGHSDYGHKLAIYSAEIVLDEDNGS